MSKKGLRRDPLEGIPYGVHALIRNEGTTIEEVALADVDLEDTTWRIRVPELVDLLAESIRTMGQLSPVILRFRERDNRWQVVTGFRRLKALQHLGRKGVQARLFDAMSDEDAIRTAVMENFFSGQLNGEHLDTFMDRLQGENLLTETSTAFLDWAREKVGRVSAGRAAPGASAGPVDASAAIATEPDGFTHLPDLIDRTFVNLSEAAQGLEKIFLNWSDVSPSDRKILAAECKYLHDIYPFLTR